jgi:DNA polymerase-3 subunit delta'
MAWQGIEGHDQIVEQFRRALGRGRLASSFLMIGPAGIGKRTFALRLAKALLCAARPEAALDPCGRCPACVQVDAGTHPDLAVVAKPPDKAFLPLELLIGDKEHRGRAGLCHHLALRPFMGGRRIATIDDADFLNPEGANCLLKTLEEPPTGSVLMLISTSPAKQLPTIRSRCQLVRFRPLEAGLLARLLLEQGFADDPSHAERLARHGEGSLQQARELADPPLWQFRGELLGALAQPAIDSVGLGRAVGSFVDQAGRDAAARRGRLRQLIGFAAEFYRARLRAQRGVPVDDPEIAGRLGEAGNAAGVAEQATALRLSRCLEAAEQVDRNANQTTLIECWLDDLATAAG